MEGTIKWFNERKGFGFVTGDDGQDYFVHSSALKEGTTVRENDRVSFDPAETDKGKQAQNVALLEKGSEAKEEAPAEEKPAEEPKPEEPEAEAAEEPKAEEPEAEEEAEKKSE